MSIVALQIASQSDTSTPAGGLHVLAGIHTSAGTHFEAATMPTGPPWGNIVVDWIDDWYFSGFNKCAWGKLTNEPCKINKYEWGCKMYNTEPGDCRENVTCERACKSDSDAEETESPHG